jgi:hypothetical protein
MTRRMFLVVWIGLGIQADHLSSGNQDKKQRWNIRAHRARALESMCNREGFDILEWEEELFPRERPADNDSKDDPYDDDVYDGNGSYWKGFYNGWYIDISDLWTLNLDESKPKPREPSVSLNELIDYQGKHTNDPKTNCGSRAGCSTSNNCIPAPESDWCL